MLEADQKFEAIFGSDIASVVCDCRSAALLDCNTFGRVAGDQRLGSYSLRRQNVEVRGFVVSVTTSPLGTTSISDENTPIKRSPGS
jgi:hypothetical protein